MTALNGLASPPCPLAEQSKFASLLNQLAFAALVLMGVMFAAEFRQPWIQTAGWIALTNVELLILVMHMFWLAARIANHQGWSQPKKITIPLILWVGWLALSALAAPVHVVSAIHFLGRVTAGIFVGWATFDLASTPRRQTILLSAFALGGILVAVQGLLEATSAEPILRWLANFKTAQTRVGDVIRVSSTLSYATIAAMVLEMIIPILVALWINARRTSLQILLGLGIAVSLAALVLTLSRGGMIAILMVLCLGAAYGLHAKQRQLWVLAGTSALLLLAFASLTLFWNPTARLRISTETEQTWYQAQVVAPDQMEARPGQILLVPVSVTNTSVRHWNSGGEQPFMLGYHLLNESGTTVTYDGARTRLPRDLAPDEQTVFDAEIHAPKVAGTYVIQWDMVQEAVSWFSWKGTTMAETTLVVQGEPVQSESISVLPPPTDVTITRPTAERRELWLAALRMAADRPLLGVGPDNFRWRYGDYAGIETWNTNIHANNIYLEWLADTGFPGFIVFLAASWVILRIASRDLQFHTDSASGIMRLALLGSLMAWYLHGFVDYFYEFTPTFVAFWLIAGMSLRMAEEAD